MSMSYNIDDRAQYKIHDEQAETMLNTTDSTSSAASNNDRCVPVEAVKELGCIVSEKNLLFKELFRPVCEQHQLCYACGFAHGITARQCNIVALMHMYELCAQTTSMPYARCLKQRFSAISLLRQHPYRSTSESFGFFFECSQRCVFDYLNN